MPHPAAAPLAAVLEEAFALWREVGADPYPAARDAGDRNEAQAARAARLLRAAETCCRVVCDPALGPTSDIWRRPDGPEPGAASRPESGPASAAAATGLTPRELEVLRLLADGLTDREIGDALFVSRRTATTHVASILTKLGAPSRAAAVAYAIRHHLA